MTKVMTRKETKTKTPAAAAAVTAGEGYKEIGRGDFPLVSITVDGNYRKIDEKHIKELAENIARVGVLQPVILRAGDGAKSIYTLVAGERRLRAAQLAGLKTIPGRVLQITAEEALEVRALENLHRKDLTPIEEARAFKILLDQKGHTIEQVEELAHRVDKSINYVYRALRLLELPANFQDHIEKGELSAAAGLQLLKLPKEQWKEACKQINWTDTAKEVAEKIKDRLGKDLNRGSFPKAEEYAGLPACGKCSFNSSNQGALFEGGGAGNKCMDTSCFKKKQAAFLKEYQEKRAKEFEGLKFLGFTSSDYAQDGVKLDSKQRASKAIKDELKARPGSFGWNIYDPSEGWSGGQMTANLICMNTKSLSPAAKKIISPHSSGGYGGGPAKPSTTPRQKFIRMEKYRALFEAARKTIKGGLNKIHYQTILKKLEPGHYDIHLPVELLNVQTKRMQYYNSYKYELLNLDELRDLVFLFALGKCCAPVNDPEAKTFTPFGIDFKAVTEKAKKSAEAAWEAKKAAKKAGKAGAGKKTKPAGVVNDDGEDVGELDEE